MSAFDYLGERCGVATDDSHFACRTVRVTASQSARQSTTAGAGEGWMAWVAVAAHIVAALLWR